MSERCVFCGGYVPEGRQVCQSCEKRVDDVITCHAKAGMTYAEAESRIAAVANVISEISSSTMFSFDDVLTQVEISAREALQMRLLGADPNFRALLFHEIEDSILNGKKKKGPLRMLKERFRQLIDRYRRNHENT